MIFSKSPMSVGLQSPEVSSGNAGIDLRSSSDAIIPANQTAVITTGIRFKIPEGMVGLVCSRSGLAAKKSVHVLNSPGIIDESYTGELQVILHNAGSEEFLVRSGDRIAQLVVMQVITPQLKEVPEEELLNNNQTTRGSNGLGSTGVK